MMGQREEMALLELMGPRFPSRSWKSGPESRSWPKSGEGCVISSMTRTGQGRWIFDALSNRVKGLRTSKII